MLHQNLAGSFSSKNIFESSARKHPFKLNTLPKRVSETRTTEENRTSKHVVPRSHTVVENLDQNCKTVRKTKHLNKISASNKSTSRLEQELLEKRRLFESLLKEESEVSL